MPKPERHVFVCTQSRPLGHPRSSCSQHGCNAVYEEFLWQLQQRNLFNRVQVTATGCLGPCSEGPSVLVYPEGIMYGGVKKEDVAALFDEHLVKGQPVERLRTAPEFCLLTPDPPCGTSLAVLIAEIVQDTCQQETQAMLTLTESAQKAIHRFIKGADTPVAGLRIAVTGGGCSGLQYAMDLVEEHSPDDVAVTCGPVTVFVEPLSAPLLRGVTLDFVDGINGSGFKFENPNASNSCGCGNSFSA